MAIVTYNVEKSKSLICQLLEICLTQLLLYDLLKCGCVDQPKFKCGEELKTGATTLTMNQAF